MLTPFLFSLLAPQGPAPETVLLKADRIHVSPTQVLAPGRLLLRAGRVAYVGAEIPEEALQGARVLEVKGEVMPAFVVVHSHLDQVENLNERYRAANTQLRAVDGFDPFADSVGRTAASGITVTALAPVSGGPIPGIAGAIHLASASTAELDSPAQVLEVNAYLKLALVPDALDQTRGPTSIMGAADLIRSQFRIARGTADDDSSQVLRSALVGGLRVGFHANSVGELQTALDLCEELNLKPLLLGAAEAGKVLPRLTALQGTVALAGLSMTDSEERLNLPARLEKAKVPFSFVADDGEQLRLSAALALSHGLSRSAALAALTQVPAEQLGLGNRFGTLLRDQAADFLVFSGDPLELSSRLLAVHIGGTKIDGPVAKASR